MSEGNIVVMTDNIVSMTDNIVSMTTGNCVFAMPKNYIFTPQEDITAFELSQALPLLLRYETSMEAYIKANKLERHFTEDGKDG
jgi:hypothetical protein